MRLKQDKKTSIIWFQGVTCNGNTHSFLNLENLEKFLGTEFSESIKNRFNVYLDNIQYDAKFIFSEVGYTSSFGLFVRMIYSSFK